MGARQVSHPRAVGTGIGLLGWIAYFGAAVAGEPLTRIVKVRGPQGACPVVPEPLLWNPL
eukprot:7061072-Pyramimonas_sp.AAC.1